MKIAVLGYGVVGSGVVELIHTNADTIAKNAGMPVEIKYILDIRDFPDSPYASLFTKSFDDILSDSEISVVVEVIGGLNPAYKFVKQSLLAGKNVVTSNKELVSVHGDELLKIAKDNNLNFLFEASVGGGIPIIRPLSQCLTANKIRSISGILNGTTNFILTKMIIEGWSFEEALKTAQKLGYAEANPSADIDGIDTCRKIAILASLAFGSHIDPDTVHTEGISEIKLDDIRYASELGYSIKLLGMVKKAENGKLFIMVAPFLVDKSLPISGVDDVYNAILVEGDAVGITMFYGRGAGKLPTASAVVADVIDCAKHLNTRKYLFWDVAEGQPQNDYRDMPCRRYVRFESPVGIDSDTVIKFFPNSTVIVNSVKLAFITPKLTEAEYKAKLSELKSKTGKNIGAELRVYDI